VLLSRRTKNTLRVGFALRVVPIYLPVKLPKKRTTDLLNRPCVRADAGVIYSRRRTAPLRQMERLIYATHSSPLEVWTRKFRVPCAAEAFQQDETREIHQITSSPFRARKRAKLEPPQQFHNLGHQSAEGDPNFQVRIISKVKSSAEISHHATKSATRTPKINK